jgi:hypothetical protein
VSCLTQKIDQTPGAELVRLAEQAAGDPTGARAEGRRIGIAYGLSCLGQPSVVSAMRGVLAADFKSAIKGKHYSAAFVRCLIGKAQHIGAAQVRQVAEAELKGQSGKNEALGRAWAQQCIASGARP